MTLDVIAKRALSRLHFRAWKALADHGPMTAREMATRARIPGLHRRLSELRDMGWARERTTTRCPKSGRMSIVWETTGRPRHRVTTKAHKDHGWFVVLDCDGVPGDTFKDARQAEQFARGRASPTIVFAREVRRWTS